MGPAFVSTPVSLNGVCYTANTSTWSTRCHGKRWPAKQSHKETRVSRRVRLRRSEISACHKSSRETKLSKRSTNTAEDVVRVFWDLTKTGSFSETVNLFTEDALYHDMLYVSPFRGRKAILSHLKDMEAILATGVVLVLDDIAAGDRTAAARWHAETPNGGRIPLSQGLSMYTLVPAHSNRNENNMENEKASSELLISEAWDFVETPFKFASVILPILRTASWVLGRFRLRKESKSQE